MNGIIIRCQPFEPNMDDLSYMKTALALAEKGRGWTSPNPMVGAVVVRGGQIVGRGFHPAAGQAHAEVNALDDAGEASRGATLYVTLEPCNHTGRTPPCTRKILNAGIQRVVVAMEDPNPDVRGGGNAFLRQQGLTVETGLCQSEAEKLNEIFIKYIRTKTPFVILKWASTLDGRIATRTHDAQWVTGPQARSFVHEVRHSVDAIMVGIDTVIADNPSLTTRRDSAEGKDPERIILDTRFRIPEDAKVCTGPSSAGTTVIIHGDGDGEKRKRLEAKGVKVISAPLRDGGIDLEALMKILGQNQITSILIEGGGGVLGSCLRQKVGDKVLAFQAPKILGGDDGVPVCRGKGPDLMASAARLSDVRVERFGDDTLIEGYL